MWKVISNILLAALAIGLTIFTASRTLDLLGQWLPQNQQVMQWLGLSAFEGGLYFWAFYFVVGAKGAVQRAVAVIMIFVCFASVAVATVADLLLVGAEDGRLPDIPATQKQFIVIFVGVVIVLNVAAFLAAKLTHPDRLKEIAVQDAEDQIHAMELAMIRQVAPSVAVQMAPIKAEQWVGDTWQRMLPNTARPMQMLGPASLPQVGQIAAPQTVEARTVEATIEPAKTGVLERAKGLFAGRQERKTVEAAPAKEQPQPTQEAPAPQPAQSQEPPTSHPGSTRPAPRGFMHSESKPATKEAARARRSLRRERRQRRKHREQPGA